MKILEILNQPWAIDPKVHAQISNIYLSHLKGPKIDFKALQDQRQRPTDQRDFQVVNNKAIIEIFGPLVPQASFFDFFFGTTGMDDIKRNIQQAKSDGNDAILHFRTPGGTVEGAFELADFIEETIKDGMSIVGFSDGQIASAGALISSPCEKVFITGKTNQIGSVGVYIKKIDITKANEEFGIKVEEFITGKYKNIGSPNRKTDEFERNVLQEQADQLLSIFVQDYSKRRSIPVETVVDWEAKIFLGKDAIKNKLVDGVATLEELLNDSDKGIGMEKLTLERFKAENFDLFNSIDQAAYQRGLDAGALTGKEEGATSERLRISGITSGAFVGQEALRDQLIADGKTSAGDAAMQFNSAQKGIVAEKGEEIKTDAPDAVTFLENQTEKPEEKDKPKDFMQQVNTYQIENKCKKSEALKAVIKLDPESHKAYVGRK